MARRAFAAREDEEAELNLTPMLDVVFIMLIFFIVTAVFVKEPGVNIERPLVANLKNVKPTIIVAVSSEDEIWINKRLVSRAELIPTLEALRAENPLAEAIVQGDTHARFDDVYAVMEALQQVGIETQTVSVRPQ